MRERAEEKLYTRLGEIRQASAERGRAPIVAVGGCVAQQEGAALLKRSSTIDVIVGTQSLKQLPALVDQAIADAADAPARIDINPYEDVSFPLGVARRKDPLKAYVTIIEGCNEFCSFCVVPYTRGHERMRPKRDIVNEVDPGGRRRPQGNSAARPDRESLSGAGRSAVRLRCAARGRSRGSGCRAHSIREPAPAACADAPHRGRARSAEGLPALSSAGAIGIDARARGDAAPLLARKLPRAGGDAARRWCRASR